MDHIDANLAEPISLSDLAAVACISAYHFARNFKIEMGISPLAFVTQRRVERAKRLLQGSGLTLAQVAYDCGFANQSHFTTVFRKHTGQTPGAYRKGR
ncbi:MAG: helix-turn-helix transcriptional regulator [Rhodomicrobium sp.]|nr:helix-turn-helix transcriptional regulator [Rhodomicrobium sp.]